VTAEQLRTSSLALFERRPRVEDAASSLELLANGEEIHHSIELSLGRFGRCKHHTWSSEEQPSANRFALAYFDAVLRAEPLGDGCRQLLDDPLIARTAPRERRIVVALYRPCRLDRASSRQSA
jgi:hypothetical protein